MRARAMIEAGDTRPPALPSAAPPRPPLGPGTLVLVVGPSGAGKDTVIGAARACLDPARPVHFARRLVTRPQGSGEAHGTLAEEAFSAGHGSGAFALSWRAHGLGYALGPEVVEVIRAGGLAVANGSREAVEDARRRFAHLKVVLVTAPLAVRAARLKARGREVDGAIAERLARDPALSSPPDLVIENVGTAEAAGRRLADFLAVVLAAARPEGAAGV